MDVLVLNAGSSSLKFSVRNSLDELVVQGQQDVPSNAVLAIAAVRAAIPHAIQAIGHRVVSGGTVFTRPTRMTAESLEHLAAVDHLAPLHNPPARAVIAAARAVWPDVPHVAVFDTQFHASIPDYAANYALPARWRTEFGVRKYGAHGLSHAYCTARIAELAPRTSRLIIAHLGQGASLSAVKDGVCVDTTMGMTPLDGLMMGTRCGAVDPGALLHLLSRCGLSLSEVEHKLNHESGLLGISGVSGDYRVIMQRAAAGHAESRLALSMFHYRIRLGIAAFAGVLGGLDALIFTAGIGENSAFARAETCNGLEYLGVHLDEAKNATACADAEISAGNSSVRVWVMHTQEDVMIARGVRESLRE